MSKCFIIQKAQTNSVANKIIYYQGKIIKYFNGLNNFAQIICHVFQREEICLS